MPFNINRRTGLRAQVTLSATLGNSTVIDMSEHAAVALQLATASSGTITWYGSYGFDGPFVQVFKTDGSNVTTSIDSNRIVATPDELFCLPFVKGVLVSGGDITATAILKS